MEKNTKKEYEKARTLRDSATYFRNMLTNITEKDGNTENLIQAYNAVIEHAAELMEFYANN